MVNKLNVIIDTNVIVLALLSKYEDSAILKKGQKGGGVASLTYFHK